MEAPKCKNCGDRHWGLCDTFSQRHGIRRREESTDRGKPIEESLASNTASNVAITIKPGASNRKQRWDREKYNAYQRDLMRKRRGIQRQGTQGDE